MLICANPSARYIGQTAEHIRSYKALIDPVACIIKKIGVTQIILGNLANS